MSPLGSHTQDFNTHTGLPTISYCSFHIGQSVGMLDRLCGARIELHLVEPFDVADLSLSVSLLKPHGK